ncbi:MAG TPA: hypothetical protein PLP86_02985 [Armatimonadota bacterium]|nr:hypothetical protein [Armatimonadota bacterium]
MKKCPKCSAENRIDAVSCFQCQEDLSGVQPAAMAGVPPPNPLNPSNGPNVPQTPPSAPPVNQPPPTTGTGPVGPANVMGRPGPLNGGADEQEGPMTVVGQPLGGPGGPQSPQGPSPYGPPRSSYGPPPPAPPGYRGGPRKPETKSSSNIGSIIATILLLFALVGGGGFAYYQFIYLANTPLGVARGYMNAMMNGDAEKAKKYMTKASLDMPEISDDQFINQINQLKEKTDEAGFAEGKDYYLELESSDESTARVVFNLNADKLNEGMNSLPPSKTRELLRKYLLEGFPLMLAKEDGKWKMDIIEAKRISQERQQQKLKELFGGTIPQGIGGGSGSTPSMPSRPMPAPPRASGG